MAMLGTAPPIKPKLMGLKARSGGNMQKYCQFEHLGNNSMAKIINGEDH